MPDTFQEAPPRAPIGTRPGIHPKKRGASLSPIRPVTRIRSNAVSNLDHTQNLTTRALRAAYGGFTLVVRTMRMDRGHSAAAHTIRPEGERDLKKRGLAGKGKGNILSTSVRIFGMRFEIGNILGHQSAIGWLLRFNDRGPLNTLKLRSERAKGASSYPD